MDPSGDEGLGERARTSIDRALRADPALAGELDLITGQLGDREREAFWAAFSCEAERCARPASAVLAALEIVAGDGRRGGA